jgi:excisionase family DNA binding protein
MAVTKSVRQAVPTTAAIVSPLMTVDEAAAYLRRPRRWVYYTLRYEIPIMKAGNRIFFEKRDLDVWIATHKEVPR